VRKPLYRDNALVLRVQRLGEADRIITLLTRRHGRVRAVAKGVRKTSSRFGARLEPFGHVDIQCSEGSSLDTVTQVEGIDLYGRRFIEDYPRYTTASAIVETAERLTPVEREPSLRIYLLTLGALNALSQAERPPILVLDAYLLRGMAYAGWAPALRNCAVCAEPGPHPDFSVPAGGLVCGNCRPPGAAHPSQAAIDLMIALLEGDWEATHEVEVKIRNESSGLVAAHLQWHLERGLRSLPLVDRRETSS
jgi:DNA repair protein RecO (recombination protein O)